MSRLLCTCQNNRTVCIYVKMDKVFRHAVNGIRGILDDTQETKQEVPTYTGGIDKNIHCFVFFANKYIPRRVIPSHAFFSSCYFQCFLGVLLFSMFSWGAAIFFQNITTPFTESGGHKTANLNLICTTDLSHIC